MDFYKKFSSRIDGRNYHQSRPFGIFFNPISSSLGSVQITTGFTSIVISMYKKSFFNQNSTESFDINLFPVKFKKNIKKLKSIKNSIIQLLGFIRFREQLKTAVSVNLFIISEDGNLLTLALNGVYIAIQKVKPLNFEFFFSSISLSKFFFNFIIDPRMIENLFIDINCYFIKLKHIEKNKYKFKILYQGQLARFSRHLCKKIIHFGKQYTNLIRILC